jgi:MFS family permease
MPEDFGFKYLLISRIFRSIGLIFVTISSPLYLKALGYSPLLIGLVFSAVVGFTAILSLSLGFLGDRKGYKKSLIIAEGISTLGVLLLVITPTSSFALLSTSLILAGITGSATGMRGLFSPGLTALVATNWKEDFERVRKMGLLSSVASLSSIGGSLMLTFMDYLPFGKIGNYKFLFFISSIFLILSFISLLFVKENREKRRIKKEKIMKKSSLKYVSKVILSNSIGAVGIGMSIPLLSLWFSLFYHATDSEIGEIFTLNYIFTSLGSFLATRIKGNILRLASFTRIMNGVFLITMALSPYLFLAGIMYILRGLNAGFGAPNRTALNIKGISPEDYGTASSLQGLATRFSQMSSSIGGYLMEIDLPLPLEIGGLLQAISGIIYLKLFRKDVEERSINAETKTVQ